MPVDINLIKKYTVNSDKYNTNNIDKSNLIDSQNSKNDDVISSDKTPLVNGNISVTSNATVNDYTVNSPISSVQITEQIQPLYIDKNIKAPLSFGIEQNKKLAEKYKNSANEKQKMYDDITGETARKRVASTMSSLPFVPDFIGDATATALHYIDKGVEKIKNIDDNLGESMKTGIYGQPRPVLDILDDAFVENKEAKNKQKEIAELKLDITADRMTAFSLESDNNNNISLDEYKRLLDNEKSSQYKNIENRKTIFDESDNEQEKIIKQYNYYRKEKETIEEYQTLLGHIANEKKSKLPLDALDVIEQTRNSINSYNTALEQSKAKYEEVSLNIANAKTKSDKIKIYEDNKKFIDEYKLIAQEQAQLIYTYKKLIDEPNVREYFDIQENYGLAEAKRKNLLNELPYAKKAQDEIDVANEKRNKLFASEDVFSKMMQIDDFIDRNLTSAGSRLGNTFSYLGKIANDFTFNNNNANEYFDYNIGRANIALEKNKLPEKYNREIYRQKYADVEGYRALLDDDGNVTSVRDNSYNPVAPNIESSIKNAYKSGVYETKIDNDFSQIGLLEKATPTAIDLGIAIYGGQLISKLGLTAAATRARTAYSTLNNAERLVMAGSRANAEKAILADATAWGTEFGATKGTEFMLFSQALADGYEKAEKAMKGEDNVSKKSSAYAVLSSLAILQASKLNPLERDLAKAAGGIERFIPNAINDFTEAEVRAVINSNGRTFAETLSTKIQNKYANEVVKYIDKGGKYVTGKIKDMPKEIVGENFEEIIVEPFMNSIIDLGFNSAHKKEMFDISANFNQPIMETFFTTALVSGGFSLAKGNSGVDKKRALLFAVQDVNGFADKVNELKNNGLKIDDKKYGETLARIIELSKVNDLLPSRLNEVERQNYIALSNEKINLSNATDGITITERDLINSKINEINNKQKEILNKHEIRLSIEERNKLINAKGVKSSVDKVGDFRDNTQNKNESQADKQEENKTQYTEENKIDEPIIQSEAKPLHKIENYIEYNGKRYVEVNGNVLAFEYKEKTGTENEIIGKPKIITGDLATSIKAKLSEQKSMLNDVSGQSDKIGNISVEMENYDINYINNNSAKLANGNLIVREESGLHGVYKVEPEKTETKKVKNAFGVEKEITITKPAKIERLSTFQYDNITTKDDVDTEINNYQNKQNESKRQVSNNTDKTSDDSTSTNNADSEAGIGTREIKAPIIQITADTPNVIQSDGAVEPESVEPKNIKEGNGQANTDAPEIIAEGQNENTSKNIQGDDTGSKDLPREYEQANETEEEITEVNQLIQKRNKNTDNPVGNTENIDEQKDNLQDLEKKKQENTLSEQKSENKVENETLLEQPTPTNVSESEIKKTTTKEQVKSTTQKDNDLIEEIKKKQGVDEEKYPSDNFEQNQNFINIKEKYKNSEDKVYGGRFKKKLPNGETITGRYVLVNKNDVSASHDPKMSFRKTIGVPVNENGKTFNDNDYETNQQAQSIQSKIAQNYDRQAIDDVVLIDSNGIVKSGNGRTISRKISTAKTSTEYTNDLKEEAERFGFTKEQVEVIGDENVMLVVELDGEPIYTTNEYAKYNAQTTKTKTPLQKAKEVSKRIDDATSSKIINILNQVENLSSLNNAQKNDLKRTLIDSGLINDFDQSTYFDENNNFTEAGKEFLENILLANIFNENELNILNNFKAIRNRLAINKVELTKNSGKEGALNVINKIKRALYFISEANPSQNNFIDDLQIFIKQGNLFDEKRIDPDDVIFSLIINNKNDLREILLSLNNAIATEDLFGNIATNEELVNQKLNQFINDENFPKDKRTLIENSREYQRLLNSQVNQQRNSSSNQPIATKETEQRETTTTDNQKGKVEQPPSDTETESKIQSWNNKWEELKKENNKEQLNLFYNKVKVALNGYAQGKGVVDEFTKLKSEIEQFAKERKAKTKEQGNKERVSSNSNEGNSALRDVESTAKALEGVDEKRLPEIIDEENYLAKNGAPFMGGAEPALHKNIQEGRAKQQMIKRVSDEMNENNQKREELRNEYNQKVKEGKIIPPSRNDRLISTANSNSDLESTQAARRLLEKKGIDWKISKSKYQSISEAYHKAKVDGSNPELVKAVEELLAPKEEVTKEEKPKFQTTDKGKFTKLGKETFDKFAKRLKAVFPKIKLNTFTDWKEALGHTQLRTPNGTVYGFVKDGQVFINENELNANTLVHEYGHIFAQILKAQYPTAHKNLIDRIKQEKALIEAKKKDPNYANLTDEQLADEVLSELIGNKGETILNTKKPIHKEILDLLNRFWNRLKNIFTTGSPNIAKWSVEQFQNATIDDIVNNVTADLLSGRKLSNVSSDKLGGKTSFQQQAGITKDEAIKRNNGNPLNLAPNGKPSILYQSYLDLRYNVEEAERLTAQVYSDNFREWFGDWQNDPENASKVVDENGMPLVVYHGTRDTTDFTEFDINKAGKGNDWGIYSRGFYFSPNKKTADQYRRLNGNIYISFLNLKNPLYLNSFENKKQLSEYLDIDEGIISDRYSVYISYVGIFTSHIKDKGHDGVIVIPKNGNNIQEIVVYSPNQIKSATENIGTFDSGSNDIRFQIIGEVGAENLPKVRENLQVARDMESEGKTPKEIYLATGWERTKDNGKWKYDLPDVEVDLSDLKELDKNQELANQDVVFDLITYRKNENGSYDISMKKKGATKTSEFAQYKNIQKSELSSIIDDKYIIDDILNNEGVPSFMGDSFEFEDAKEIKKEFNSFVTGGTTLSRVAKGDIFNAYPKLKDVVVVVDKNHESQGSYSVRDGQIVITLKSTSQKYAQSTLIHEIQHAIQDIEGFARGGNMQTANARINIDYIGLLDVIEKISKVKNITSEKIDKLANKNVKYIYERENWNRVKSLFSEGKLSEKDFKEITIAKNPIEYYKRLAGEVEARNVQKRATMTAEERRQQMLSETEDVAEESKVYIYEADKEANKQQPQFQLSDSKTIDNTNYFNNTKATFTPISSYKASKILDEYIKQRRKKNKPEYIEVDGEKYSVDYESERKSAFWQSRSLSYYFISEDKKRLIRISDHWSDTHGKYPRSKKLNVGNIRSVYWDIKDADDFEYRMPSQQYPSRLIAGEVAFDEMKPRIQFQLNQDNTAFSEVIDGFYSPLEKIINESKFDKLPAKQWIDKFAKGEEAKWTGLTDWLTQQQGSVSKAEIQQFLKDNRIQVVEVVKGEVSNFTKDDIADVKINQHGAGNWVVKTKEDGTVEFPLDKADDKAEAIEYALEQLNYDNKSKRESKPKFQQYQLEGEKENYKEVLITMPHMEGKVHNTKFKSTHFDEPNILVHLRMNTRTDAAGKKVLFLEEVQSDWGQTGKKDGFKTSENVWDTQLGKDAVAAIKDMDNLGFDSWQQAATAISKSKDPLNDFDINYEHKDLILKWRDAVNQERKTSIAPFVTDTNAWTKLGLKVALKEAVAQGADKIAWTTGTQQFERWGSEKIDWKAKTPSDYTITQDKLSGDWIAETKIKGVGLKQQFPTKSEAENYAKTKTFIVNIEEQTGGTAFDGININEKALSEKGSEVNSKKDLRNIIEKTLKRERNDAEIDKLTDRIWNRMQTEDSGTSLPRKEGMEEFYGNPKDMERTKDFTIKKEGELFAVKDEKGKTIRTFKQENEANKFKENYGLGIVGNVAKSLFKQEPKTIELQTTSTRIPSQDKVLRFRDWVWKNKTEEYSYNDAQKDIDINSKLYQEYQKNLPTQHSIDITPEMRASVESGLPLFLINDKEQKLFETSDKTKATKENLQNKFNDAIVVQSESELPQAIQDEIKQQRAEGKVKGVYYNGQVYMVADNINTIGEATGTYRHETLGHKGVIDYLGEKIDELAVDLVNNAKGIQIAKLKELAKRYGFPTDFSKLTDNQKSDLGQEYIAFISENNGKYPSAWRKIVDFVKQSLRDFGIELNVSDKEIEALIGKVEQRNKNIANTKQDTRFSLLKDSDFDKNGNVKASVLKEITEEKANIKAKAQANGTFMKAPNGKPTNLNEEQWVMVRTKAFKEWFGDWENANKSYRKVFQERHVAFQALKDNGLRGAKFNSSDGSITVYHGTSKDAEGKILNNGFNDSTYFSINKNGTSNGDSPLDVAKRKFGKDAAVMEIKIDPRDIELAAAGSELYSPYRLIKAEDGVYSKEVNASKVVDENGEPLVVYHGTNNNFNEFKRSESIGTHNESDQLEGIYFTDNIEVADWFTNTGNVIKGFLNIRNPYKSEGIKTLKEEQSSSILKGVSDKVKKQGFDGIILEVGFEVLGEQKLYLAFEPNQIKSATGNVGTFDSESNDIRFNLKTSTLSNNNNNSQKSYNSNIAVPLLSNKLWSYIAGDKNKFRSEINSLIEMVDEFENINIPDNIKTLLMDDDLLDEIDVYLRTRGQIKYELSQESKDLFNYIQKTLKQDVRDIIENRSIQDGYGNLLLLTNRIIEQEQKNAEKRLKTVLSNGSGFKKLLQYLNNSEIAQNTTGVLRDITDKLRWQFGSESIVYKIFHNIYNENKNKADSYHMRVHPLIESVLNDSFYQSGSQLKNLKGKAKTQKITMLTGNGKAFTISISEAELYTLVKSYKQDKDRFGKYNSSIIQRFDNNGNDITKYEYIKGSNGLTIENSEGKVFNGHLSKSEIDRLESWFDNSQEVQDFDTKINKLFDAIYPFLNEINIEMYGEELPKVANYLTLFTNKEKYDSVMNIKGAGDDKDKTLRHREGVSDGIFIKDIGDLINYVSGKQYQFIAYSKLYRNIQNMQRITDSDASLMQQLESTFKNANAGIGVLSDIVSEGNKLIRDADRQKDGLHILAKAYNKIFENFARSVFWLNYGTGLKQYLQMGSIAFNGFFNNDKHIWKQKGWYGAEVLLQYGGKRSESANKKREQIIKSIKDNEYAQTLLLRANPDDIIKMQDEIGLYYDDITKIDNTNKHLYNIRYVGNKLADFGEKHLGYWMRRSDANQILLIYAASESQIKEQIEDGKLYDSNGNNIKSLNDKFAKQKIAELANDVVLRTTNMNVAKDNYRGSRFKRSNSIAKFAISPFLLFSGQNIRQFNNVLRHFDDYASSDNKQDENKHLKNAVKSLSSLLVTNAIGATSVDIARLYGQDMLMKFINWIIGDDDDEDSKSNVSITERQIFVRMLKNIFGSMPSLLGKMGEYATEYYLTGWANNNSKSKYKQGFEPSTVPQHLSVLYHLISNSSNFLYDIFDGDSKTTFNGIPFDRSKAKWQIIKDASQMVGFPVTISNPLVKAIDDKEAFRIRKKIVY